LQSGEPFLFKLHSPDDFVVGGGFFGHFSILPVSLAWEAFGQKNGAMTEEEMRARVEHYRRGVLDRSQDYNVGCILLEGPFFFRREDWVPLTDWSKSIVRGKGLDTNVEPGTSLWQLARVLLTAHEIKDEVMLEMIKQDDPRYGAEGVRFLVEIR
jgi:putative restriction endonuclease